MLDNKDYMTRLSRARRRRKGFPDWRILLAAGGAVVLLALGGGGIYYYVSTRPQVPAAADSQRAADTETSSLWRACGKLRPLWAPYIRNR